MPGDLDINKVIQSGSRQMDISELAKLGHKRVRVIDEARIRELIMEAVQERLRAEEEDVVRREKRLAMVRAKHEIEGRLAENISKLEAGAVPSADAAALAAEISRLKAELARTTESIEAEKRRIAEESRAEFEKFLRGAKEEIEARSSSFEKALRGLIERACAMVPADARAAMPKPPDGEAKATALIEMLGGCLAAIGKYMDGIHSQINAHDQDIAMAAAEHRRLEMDLARARQEVERLNERLRAAERQLDARDQDISLAALEQRRLQAENKKLQAEAARVAELSGELRRLSSERELLLSRVAELSEKQSAATEQLASVTDKLTQISAKPVAAPSVAAADLKEVIGTLKEEIGRQVAWAVTAQKTGGVGGAGAIDPGLQLDALFSRQIETNVEAVKVQEQKSESVADKLAKLRQAKGEKKQE